MTTLFISDLHLDENLPQVTALLESFIHSEVADADAFYILGDLFEVWVGDDDDRPATRHFISLLKRAADTGTPVYFMHGNRDFLVGTEFCKQTGITLLSDPTVIMLNGKAVLLMHGDSLCTDDTQHQTSRALMRSQEWQQDFLAMSLQERIDLAQQYRNMSRAEISQKTEMIMDVNAQAVINVMHEHGVDELIHGHTHRPAIHVLEVDGMPARRIVLGDWHESGSVLRADGNERSLEAWPA
jgi:UDP-2,3-diacylglucosamine hydrolase